MKLDMCFRFLSYVERKMTMIYMAYTAIIYVKGITPSIRLQNRVTIPKT